MNHNLFQCFLHIFVPRSKQTYLNHHVSYFYWNNCRISIIIYSMYTVDIFIHIYLYVASLPFVFHPFQRWELSDRFFRSPGASRLAGCLSCGRGGKTPAGGSDVFFPGFLGVYFFWSFFWGVDLFHFLKGFVFWEFHTLKTLNQTVFLTELSSDHFTLVV